ncbi:MAG TPA: nitroreductase family protein [Acidimicrobiales bacterium]
MELFEAIRTTRAMRRLDPERPVGHRDLLAIVEAASKAPSGGNLQPTRWLIVTDENKRRRLGDIYRACWKRARVSYQSAVDSGDEDAAATRLLRSADHLGEHMGQAPAIVIPCARGHADASVWPAVQNLLLAARALGLGTTLTTVHRLREADVKEVLDVPEAFTPFAMIPVGYPLGKWSEAPRRPTTDIAYWNAWKQPPPTLT